MLRKPLDFDPGERYAYSNFGYCLLGRVIEHKTGKPYGVAVRELVLAPLKMTNTQLGATRIDRRAEREVTYYAGSKGASVFADDLQQEVPRPYGAFCLEAMDAHGGWLSTTEDLLKFASAFDNRERCPILPAALIDEMFARPDGLAGHDSDGKPKDVYYSLVG